MCVTGCSVMLSSSGCQDVAVLPVAENLEHCCLRGTNNLPVAVRFQQVVTVVRAPDRIRIQFELVKNKIPN